MGLVRGEAGLCECTVRKCSSDERKRSAELPLAAIVEDILARGSIADETFEDLDWFSVFFGEREKSQLQEFFPHSIHLAVVIAER